MLTRGEMAMDRFMTDASVLGYLNKGDVNNAMLLLRSSADASWLIADNYGDWRLQSDKPGAMDKWFVVYDQLREKLPSSSAVPHDEEYEKKVDVVLKAATQRAGKSEIVIQIAKCHYLV